MIVLCEKRLDWAPPDLCLPQCVFRDWRCIRESASPRVRGLVDTQSVCPAALQIPWGRDEGGGASTRYIAPEGGLYQIQCQSVNTHRGKHRPGDAQLEHGQEVRRVKKSPVQIAQHFPQMLSN